MRKTFSLLSTLLVCTSQIIEAQDSGPVVPIGFVNAVGLAGKTDFQIDGRSLKPAGFSAGGYASSFGVSPGVRQFSFTTGETDKLAHTVEIKERVSSLFVLYKVAVPQPNRTVKNVLKLTEIPPQPPPKGPRFYAFSTLEGRRATLNANGTPVLIDPLKLTPLSEGFLTLEGEGLKRLHTKPNESANYVLVLFDGVDSKMKWAMVEMTR
jgi:hypothetical protein